MRTARGADKRPDGTAPERGGKLKTDHHRHGREGAVPERGPAEGHPRDARELPDEDLEDGASTAAASAVRDP